MAINIVEIKAKMKNEALIRVKLKEYDARLKGIDKQKDTYFFTHKEGDRLKYREGNVENNLIYYNRDNQPDPKLSEVMLFPTQSGEKRLKEILTALLGVKVVVEKKREIYFIDNVKIHLDKVKGLGEFVEIEAIDEAGKWAKEELDQQCRELMNEFQIQQEDLLTHSYSDMILNR